MPDLSAPPRSRVLFLLHDFTCTEICVNSAIIPLMVHPPAFVPLVFCIYLNASCYNKHRRDVVGSGIGGPLQRPSAHPSEQSADRSPALAVSSDTATDTRVINVGGASDSEDDDESRHRRRALSEHVPDEATDQERVASVSQARPAMPAEEGGSGSSRKRQKR